MFIGHYAVGFAAKYAAPKASLGPLMAAPILLDLLWPIFLLAGWERVRIDPGNTAFTPLAFDSYPISHSLVTSIGWGALFGGLYWIFTRYRAGAVAIVLGVVSHWALDWVTHGPDLPLYPGGPKVGLGLWNSIPWTLAVEFAMLAIALWLYVRTTQPRDRTGRYGLWAFVALAIVMYAGNLMSPPPPSVQALALFALSGWIVPFWAGWFDAHRNAAK
jgi:membrane-bound metal-dependent hydrolase YbcI (DUF457 family)